MAPPQQSLEQYVANRYLNDLQQKGIQPVYHNDVKPLEEAMAIMATLNKAAQIIRRSVTQQQSKQDPGQRAVS